MATEISNGRQTVKLYSSVNRGKAMYQLAYYAGGRRVQRNFADKSQAKRVAKQILGNLSNDADAIEAMATPELESLVAARRLFGGLRPTGESQSRRGKCKNSINRGRAARPR
jgi:hypothetical protein